MSIAMTCLAACFVMEQTGCQMSHGYLFCRTSCKKPADYRTVR